MKNIFQSTFLILLIFSWRVDTLAATAIVSGISSNEINIDTQFKGAEILLFGARNEAGDVIIAIRGPKKKFLVNKKERLLGIWYNGQRVKFEDIPSFYSLFSTFQRNNIADETLKDFELGKGNLDLKLSTNIPLEKQSEFKSQLIEQLENKNLFQPLVQKVEFLDETLFKAVLKFPKNIALGDYLVEIYLLNDASVSSFQAIPIYVNQVGFSSKVSNFANQQPVLYGLFAVLFALLIGWLANYVFTRFVPK